MGFHDSLLNVTPDQGYSSGWSWDTIVQTTASGHETRIQRRSQGRRRCIPTFSVRGNSELVTAENFLNARRGSAHSFRWLDITDYTSAADRLSAPANTDQVILTPSGGSPDGTATIFQLRKVYDDGVVNPWYRKISLPITGSVVVAIDGVNQASGWSVNTTTGEVTFSVAPTLGQVVTAGFQHHCAMRFEESVDKFAERKALAAATVNQISLPMLEVLDETEWSDTRYAGGYKDWGELTADVAFDATETIQQFGTTAGNFNAYLPPTGPLPGGVIFKAIIVTGSGGHTLQLKDHEGSNVGSAIAQGSSKQVQLFNDGTNAIWRVA